MRGWACIALLAASALGARPATAALRPAYGGRAVVVAAGSSTTGADPLRARTDAARLIAGAVHCTVPDLLAVPPELVEGGRRARLRLKDNLSFHDGTALTAADVARSLARVADLGRGAPSAWRLLAVAGVAERLDGGSAVPAVRAVSPLTVELDLAVPGVNLTELLDDPGLAVLKADGRTGCGAFRLDEGAGDRGASLTPFEHHPAGRPFLDRLVVLPVDADAAQRAIDLPGVDLAVGAAARRGGRPTGPPRHLSLLVVNGSPSLQRVLASAVDRESLVRFLVGGGAKAMGSLLPGGDSGGTSAAAPDDRPPAQRLELAFDASHPTHRRVAERIQVRLHDLGGEVVLAPVPASRRDELASGAYPLALLALPALPAEPGLWLVALAHALLGPTEAQQVLAKVTRAGGEPDALAAIAAELAARLPVVPLYAEPDYLWQGTELLGLHPTASGAVDLADLWRWPLDTPPGDEAP